jgi:glutamate formiminotransferase/formiminotetrahydrofolate cyclodeaminase
VAFDEVCKKAEARGIRVTGSELVGLVPLNAMLQAGRHYLKKQKRSTGVSDSELIKIAVKSMGLDELGPFDPQEKIIEYQLRKGGGKRLVDMSLSAFMEETASESPAPGGGSVSAYMGAVGTALATMVANLSSHKRGWDDRWEEFSDWAEKGKAIQEELLRLVDEDTQAFNGIMAAFGMPKKTAEEQESRKAAIETATLQAIKVPFQVMKVACEGFEVARAMASGGNPNSVSDAGVGALALHACVEGAWLNVKINSGDMDKHPQVIDILKDGEELRVRAEQERSAVLALVNEKL